MSKRKTHEEFLEELHKITPSIKVLERYVTATTKLSVQCIACGNIWKATPCSLLAGHGCPECGKQKIGLALRKTNATFLEELAALNKNIEVLDEYKGSNQKVALRCKSCSYEWKAAPHDLLSGHGCPKCGYEQQKKKQRDTHDIFLQKLEKVNKDIIVLNEYTNNHTKLMFQCQKCGRTWFTVPNSVLSGHGCPNCARSSTSFLEQAILQAFTLNLGADAVLARDRTLIGMELDIVIPSLKIVYEPGSWVWHYNKQKRDTQKREKCKEKGYRLITIYTDYKESSMPYETDCYTSSKLLGNSDWEEVKALVEELLSEQNLKVPQDQWDLIRSFALEKSKKKTTEEYKKAVSAINPNIAVLGEYADNSTKIEHECLVCGRTWFVVPGSILAGYGCPYCGRQRSSDSKRKTHDEITARIEAANPNTIVLGQYVGSKAKIRCRCRTCGFAWDATPNNLLKGQGCPMCGRKQAASKNSKTHERFVCELADKNPSLRVLGHYVNSSEKLEVECCKCGYSWRANPMDILNGHGCPKCAGSMKKSNEQFVQELYRLLPDIEPLEEYRSANEKIRIKCRVCDFVWTTRPHDLLRSKGCPQCRKKK